MRNQPNQGALRVTIRKRWDNIEILHAIAAYRSDMVADP
jgi:hypothetical protein